MGPDSSTSDEIRRFEEQFRRQPESLVFARLADAYRKAGQPEKALATLDEGLIRHPDYPSGHIVRARALRDLGRTNETLESFRRVLELDGANLVAIQELAAMADERGDTGEARHWYERLAQIDPTNREVRQRLKELETFADDPPAGEKAEPAPEEGIRESEAADVEGPDAWWDDSAVDRTAGEPGEDSDWGTLPEPADLDRPVRGERPADDVVEAILNGNVPETVRAEDTWWYEEASDSGEPEPSRDADLLTRTMADLYAEQGLHREAAEIYEELLRDSPDDPELLARLEAVKEEPSGGPEGSLLVASPELPEVGDQPIAAGRPAGTPWTEELHRLLRMGEERAADLPDPETSYAFPADGTVEETREEPVVEETDVREAPELRDAGGRSRFASEWLRGLETDG